MQPSAAMNKLTTAGVYELVTSLRPDVAMYEQLSILAIAPKPGG